jgi:hypothetical protein
VANNPIKGEVGFEVEGQPHTLQYTINSLCVLEDKLNMSVGEIGQRMSADMRLGFLRTVFWAGLQEHHPDITERDAGEMISAVGPAEVGQMIGQAFSAAFTSPKEDATRTERPRKAPTKAAADGNGKASSPSGVN